MSACRDGQYTDKIRYSVYINGIVQGVGFRPFVYNSALLHFLQGWVTNTSEGVFLEVEGERKNIDCFIKDLKSKAPPLAVIDTVNAAELPFVGYSGFTIRESAGSSEMETYISPDAAVCDDCLSEIYNPTDRRYLYPFINCTNCGPRFTITRGIPYDRHNTTMDSFLMCHKCRKEYEDPYDRRFHAQPVACPDCGPRITLLDKDGISVECVEDITGTGTDKILRKAAELLKEGKILAVKGLGGYHLACNALDQSAVKKLRKRKFRDGKAFAIMVKDSSTADKYCFLEPAEKELLESVKRPIVLLKRRQIEKSDRFAELSPDNFDLGVMLPYTPLHHLLFGKGLEALVMTSGNISGEPIFFEDKEAIIGLGNIADYFLIHNREIYMRMDDSVTSVFEDREYLIRRSRGYVPQPIDLSCVLEDLAGSAPASAGESPASARTAPTCSLSAAPVPVILSCGGELKNTFCLVKGTKAFLSHHIGDLENPETLSSFEKGIEHFKNIFSIQPSVIAHDSHPEYLSSKYALEQEGCRKVPIQHHHAHIAACMADNRLSGPVIGVAFDGTGYGEDGCIWGGEFFSGGYSGFHREAHLEYVRMPGGDACIREPWRMTLSYLWHYRNELGYGQKDDFIGCIKQIKAFDKYEGTDLKLIEYQLNHNLNSPLTSSMGRLFDTVSALLGICSEITYEGQAAIRLEKEAVYGSCGNYEFEYKRYLSSSTENGHKQCLNIGSGKLIRELISDIVKGNISIGEISAKFHMSVAVMTADICEKIREDRKLNRVVLSGGVFQNRLLLASTVEALRKRSFEVFVHSRLPANDGCIALGQAAISLREIAKLHRM